MPGDPGLLSRSVRASRNRLIRSRRRLPFAVSRRWETGDAKSTRSSDRDQGRFAAGLFAATVVMTGGARRLPDDRLLLRPRRVAAAGPHRRRDRSLALMLWLLIDPPAAPSQGFESLSALRRERARRIRRVVSPQLPAPSGRQFGTNKPPTADDLRQIKEDSNAWYPSDRRVDDSLSHETRLGGEVIARRYSPAARQPGV